MAAKSGGVSGCAVACLLATLGCGADAAEADPRARCYPEVHFGDPRLEIQVRARVGLPDGPLTVEMLAENWTAPDSWPPLAGNGFFGLRDLEGVQCLPIEEFGCRACTLDDLAPLADMPLTAFVCTECSLAGADLGVLSALDTLERLIIREAELENVDAILGGQASMPALRELALLDTELHEPHGAPALPALETLVLRGNHIRAVPPTTGMPELRRLDLSDNPIADLSPLANLPHLGELTLRDGEITSVEPLAELDNLRVLDLSGNRVEDIAALPARLEKLILSNNRIHSGVESLAAMPQLASLALDGNQIPSMAGIETPALTNLALEDNALTSLAGLRAPMLYELTLDRNPLPSLAGLDAPTLVELSAANCQLASLDGLAGLPALEELYVPDNQISDLGGLAGREIVYVDLSRNPIGTLTGLSPARLYNLTIDDVGLESLAGIEVLTMRQLSAADNAITDVSPLADAVFTGFEIAVDLSRNPISDITPLAAITQEDSAIILEGATVTDLSQLHLFTGDVNLRSNGIVDASVLTDTDLTLRRLVLADNAIAELPALKQPIGVDHLDLSGNAITAITNPWPVYLKELDLSGNKISDLSGLCGAVHILDLSDNAITSLAGFSDVEIRALLDLSSNALSDLDGFDAGMHYEAELNLVDNHLVDVSALVQLEPRLGSLNLSGNALTEFPALPGGSIDLLNLSNNPMTTIGAVETLELRCSGCALTSVGAIAQALTTATLVDLSANPLADIAGLAGAPDLVHVYLDAIATSDFASLAPLFNRQDFEFSARGNGITDVSPFAGVANWVDLRDNAITDLSPLAGVNWGSYDLRGNPLDVDLSLWTLTLLCMFDDDVAVVWGGAPHVYGCERTDYTGS